MKTRFTILLTFLSFVCFSQADLPTAKFHEGSNLYINGKPEEALASVNAGLRMDPGNEKLNALKKLLEQEKKKQEQQKKEQQKKEQQQKEQQKQQQKDQQKKDQEKKDQEKKDQEQKDQENKEQKDAEKKEQEKKDQEKKEQENKDQKDKEKENKEVPPEVLERLKQMKISEDKARMILEAMKNQEIQYLQQNKRKASKPKDRGKPDW